MLLDSINYSNLMKRAKHHRLICVPQHFIPYLFPFLLSGSTTFLVTGLLTIRILGIQVAVSTFSGFLEIWMNSYLYSWLFSYPTLLLMIPVVRKIVNALTDDCDCCKAM
jgi:hypothetical protein